MFSRLFSSISSKKVGTIIGCTALSLYSSETKSYCAKYTQKPVGVQINQLGSNKLNNFAIFIDEGKNVPILVPQNKIGAFLKKNPQFSNDKIGYVTNDITLDTYVDNYAIYDDNGWYIFSNNTYTNWFKKFPQYNITNEIFYDIFEQMPERIKNKIFENICKKIRDGLTQNDKKFVNALSKEQKINFVKTNVNFLSVIDNISFEICIEALKKDINALKYIPDEERVTILQFSDKTITLEQAKEMVNIYRLQNDPNFKLSNIVPADVTDKVKKVADEMTEKNNISGLRNNPTEFGLNKIPQSEITANVRKVALEVNPTNVIYIDATEEEKRDAICRNPDIVLQIKNPSDNDKITAILQNSSLMPQLKDLNVKVYATVYNDNIKNIKYVPKNMVQKVRDYVVSKHFSVHPKCVHCNR